MTTLERLLRVPRVEADYGFDLAPDGATAAFSWNLTGRWELYALSLAGPAGPQLLLPGPGSRFNPQFSPVDLQSLACVADFDGSESYHLLLLSLSSGETVDLTPAGGLQPNFAWSPDGREIAFLANRSGCFDVYLLDLETRQESFLCALGCPAWEVTWSPDGRHLAVTAETTGSDYGIYLLKSSVSRPWTGENRQIFESRDPAWSPDGRKLAFSATRGEYDQIGLLDLASGEILWLTEGPGDKTSPAWDASGEQLSYLHYLGATNRLVVHKLTDHFSLNTFSLHPGLHAHPRFTPDGQHLLFLFENPQNPPDLWSLALETGLFRPLTRSLPADLDLSGLPLPVEILYPGLDDVQVPALLYRPGTAPAPAVVNVHGGPAWQYALDWNPFMSHLASRGWTVLAPNYRGSTGYGRAWQTANRCDLGGGDTRDVAAGAEYLLREGLAQAARIVVTGRSHGGYLVMTCLTQYPDLWAAGSGEAPFFDWFASHAAAREDLQHWNLENMGDPVEKAVLWRERSPYFYLDRVRVPVQILCGGLDPRCPAVEVLAARDRLLELGKEVEFWLYPDEGHVFLKLENVLEAETRRVDFLARYLCIELSE
jgi:dipeptidyl aminopeptidase/acylaminoacyl peptidase